MGKIITLIFGAILGLLGLNSILGIYTAPAYMFFVVGGMGVIIMFTPIMKGKGFYSFIRRWIFGAFLVLSAFGALIPGLSNVSFMSAISYGTFVSGLIILIIGAIYLLSVFRNTREMEIGSY